MNEKFNKFYNDNKKYLAHFLYSFVKNEAICEELLQEIFLKVYMKNIDNSKPYARNYLFIIARAAAYDYVKKEKNRNRLFWNSVRSDSVIFNPSFEKNCIEKEMISNLHDTINSFPEKERKIFIENQIECRCIKETIEKHNVTLYAIKKIRKKILKRIKDNFESFYPDD